MGDIESWIKMQLKRGVSPDSIKAAMAARSYPPAALAKVDSIRKARFVQGKAAIVFALVVAASLFVLLSFAKSGREPVIPPVQHASQPYYGLCDRWHAIASYTVSCADAVKAAEAQLGGAEAVSIGSLHVPGQAGTKEFWIITTGNGQIGIAADGSGRYEPGIMPAS
ncbi:TPA: hypothetical protein HA231_03075 [Candidatus Woesearchaeota archaeon]|nr:hypothetical protein [Candidatus Woesearchaeota archaeon]